MILQRDPWIAANHPAIKDGGCYLFSLLWFAVVYTHISIDAQFICDDLYPMASKRHYIGKAGSPLWMLRPDMILRMCGLDVEYLGHASADYQCGPGEFEILKFHHPQNGWDHFVAGNGSGIVTYDPWGAVAPYDHSLTVSEGTLESKRRFRRI